MCLVLSCVQQGKCLNSEVNNNVASQAKTPSSFISELFIFSHLTELFFLLFILKRGVNQGGCGGKGWGCPHAIHPLQGVWGELRLTSTASTSLLSSLPFISPSPLHTLASSSGMKSSERCLSLTPPRACSGLLTKNQDPFTGSVERQGGAWRTGGRRMEKSRYKNGGKCCCWKEIPVMMWSKPERLVALL